MALSSRAHTPEIDYPAIRVVRMSGEALHTEIQEFATRAGSIRVYSAPKTVADCFKFRNKIGIDVALEALRDYNRNKDFSVDKLWNCARVCRVQNVIRPYLESVIR